MFWVDLPPDSVAELADRLRQDPVIIEQQLGGGDTRGSDERITAAADELDFPVYVALVEPPSEVSPGGQEAEELAIALSRQLREPGLYVVGTQHGVHSRLVGVDIDPTLFSLHVSANVDAVTTARDDAESGLLRRVVEAETEVWTATAPVDDDYTEASLPDERIDELAERDVALLPYETPQQREGYEEEPEPWGIGKRWMVGTTAGLGALLLVWHLLSGWPWRRAPTGATSRAATARRRPPDPARERARADGLLTKLAEDLAEHSDEGRDPAAAAHLQAAVLAREVAEPLLGSSDPLDLIGAGVLARIGRHEVARARGRTDTPLRPCFFDPRHSAGTWEAEWRFGDATVEVPVCKSCRLALAEDRWPDTLIVGRRRLPYYDGDTVWARTGFGALTDDLAGQVARDREGHR